ncbi:hypothetical protein [Marinimicrobium sp. LS-A18]|uniref:hypothetical protein n=1 Tax=Marinimicrobium sp. LS-A18 TaxID=1381596 RepID=UPI001269185F|nr:hypothetical protein [Marinimicrobium sp. LS-A18]
MEQQAAGSPVVTLVMYLVLSVALAVVANLLAREKGRNVTLWTILAVVPVVNFWCIAFFVGAANLRLERKIDKLLELRGKGN